MESTDDNLDTRQHKKIKTRETLSQEETVTVSSMTFRQMQRLVGEAGEALGLTKDPLLTLVGLRIEEMVEADLDIENWEQSNSEDADICDLILNTPGGELQAVNALKRK